MEVATWDWWGFVALLLILCGFCVWVGYEICQLRHKQHGIGVDPWEYIVPDDPRDLTKGGRYEPVTRGDHR